MKSLSILVTEYIQNGTLVCPLCLSKLQLSDEEMRCGSSGCAHAAAPIPTVAGRIPILVDFSKSILSREKLLATEGKSLIPRTGNKYDGIKSIFWGSGSKTRKNVIQFVNSVPKHPDKNSTVLIIGGGAVGHGAYGLYGNRHIDVLSFDIYASPHTDFIADGHSLPIADHSIDGIWIQAVLEHVMYPHRVVAEIYRVLKNDGVVYAETPFQQHVHEGPYDFTRFTESGHRLLFKNFALLDSGALTGIGTVLLWNIRYAVWGLTRSRKLAIVAAMLFSWIRFFDRLVPDSFNVDTASGVFFLGRKDAGHVFSDRDIVAHYKGFQRG